MTEHIVLVNFLNTISGEQKEYEHDVSYPEYEGVFQDFIWSEGNYSCDCNRSLFFFGHGLGSEWPCNTGNNYIVIENIIDRDTKEVLWTGDAPVKDE